MELVKEKPVETTGGNEVILTLQLRVAANF